MAKYKGMTIEEHKEAAKLLREISDTYEKLLTLVSGKYPVSLIDPLIRECNIGVAGRTRSKLDDYFYQENPKWNGIFIYYSDKGEQQ